MSLQKEIRKIADCLEKLAKDFAFELYVLKYDPNKNPDNMDWDFIDTFGSETEAKEIEKRYKSKGYMTWINKVMEPGQWI